jgi:hypothetical protein
MTIPKLQDIRTTAFSMELSKITQSDVFRTRERDDEDIIETYTEVFAKYKEAMDNGEKPEYPFPPIWTWQHDGTHTLIAGFHRDAAARRAGLSEIQVKVFTGTEAEAIWFAMRDNRTNGLRLKHGDLKYCIVKALKRFTGLTAGAVAVELGCSRSYANEISKELSDNGQLETPDKRIGADKRARSSKREGKKGSNKDKTKTGTPAKKSKEQPPTLEEQISVALVTLDALIESQPSREERVRILDGLSKWERKQRDNLPPLPKTGKAKPIRVLPSE